MSVAPVVDTDWLAQNLNNPIIAIVDVRPPYFYGQAHLPGAVNLPFFFLSTPSGGPPGANALAGKLGQLSIDRDTHIVAYDDGASPTAARLYWVMTYYRHPAVSVLDGGITKWRHEGRDWEYTSEHPIPKTYRVDTPNDSIVADLDRVRDAIAADDAIIVDVRSPAEYLGSEVTAARLGHIPGAVNIDWSNTLVASADSVRHLDSDDELRRLYEEAGVSPDKEVIVHCQSGQRSSQTFLVLRKLGYPNVRNYVGGWQEWGNRDDTPVESV